MRVLVLGVEGKGRAESGEVVLHLVMVEGHVVGTAVVGHNLEDVLLLAGRELVLAVVVAIVRAFATAEVLHHALACLGALVTGDVAIERTEAPGHLDGLVLGEAPTCAVGPGLGIDGRTAEALAAGELIGLVVQALMTLGAAVVETALVGMGNFLCRYQFFHKT